MSDSIKLPKASREAPRRAKSVREPTLQRQALAVVRDVNFLRTVADTTTAVFIGKDMEISLLALSPTLTTVYHRDKTSTPVDTDHEQVYVETAVIRMTPDAAAYLAYNTLFSLLQNGDLEFNKLQRSIDQMKAQLPAASKGAS